MFNIVGGTSALLQLVAFFYLLKDGKLYSKSYRVERLFKVSLFAFFLKLVLQIVSSFPYMALLAYHQRNFVIAYLHLALLGFITLFVFAAIIEAYKFKWSVKLTVGLSFFLFSFFTTEALLVMHALAGMYGFTFQNYTLILLWLSGSFPLGIAFIIQSVFKAIHLQKTIPDSCLGKVQTADPIAFQL